MKFHSRHSLQLRITTVAALFVTGAIFTTGTTTSLAQESADEAPVARLQAQIDRQAAEVDQARAENDRLRAEQEQAIAEAEQSLQEAQQSLEEVHAEIAESRAEAEEVRELQRELSRVHRELQEASREVARAHRELALTDRTVERVQMINLGDRAVMGVVIGEETDEGVVIRGISPDGPAERAGMQEGDVLTSINSIDLAGGSEEDGRDAVFEVMSEVETGDILPVTVLRDGDALDLAVTVEAREPMSWQSVIRLPTPMPGAPGTPAPPAMIVNGVVVPDIDEEALAERIELIKQQAQAFEYRFVDDDGQTVEFVKRVQIEGEPLAHFGAAEFQDANVFIGFPLTRGLELASVNPELGKYFKAERGVLVIRAKADNAYSLESGDVIQSVDGAEVNSPGDLLRALRETEPGMEIELGIKRDRRDRTLTATVPENRFGMVAFPQATPEAFVVPAPSALAPLAPVEAEPEAVKPTDSIAD